MGASASTPDLHGTPHIVSGDPWRPPMAPVMMWPVRPIAPVFLHIYDVGKRDGTQAMNRVLRAFGTGVFHVGVEVYNREWSYRGGTAGRTGIFVCQPRMCEHHTYCESVAMGGTRLSEEEVLQSVQAMEGHWHMNNYDVLRHNCCHFADTFCLHLGVGEIPSWVKSAAGVGAAVDDQVGTWTGRTRSPIRSSPAPQPAMLRSPAPPRPVTLLFPTQGGAPQQQQLQQATGAASVPPPWQPPGSWAPWQWQAAPAPAPYYRQQRVEGVPAEAVAEPGCWPGHERRLHRPC